MNHISDLSGKGLPSGATLLKASGAVAIVAALVLVAAVLPAEYGIDPIGMADRLGLLGMSSDAQGSRRLRAGDRSRATMQAFESWSSCEDVTGIPVSPKAKRG